MTDSECLQTLRERLAILLRIAKDRLPKDGVLKNSLDGYYSGLHSACEPALKTIDSRHE